MHAYKGVDKRMARHLATYPFFFGQGTVITNTIIDGNANGKGHPTFHGDAADLFGKELARGRVDYGMAKFAKLQNLGADLDFLEQALQGQIDNLGRFLVFRTNVAVCMLVRFDRGTGRKE